MELTELILRLILSFFTLFILARIMGRKEISQLTFFNFVSAISIGSIAANLAINANMSIRNGIIALIAWTIFTLLLAFIDIKFKKARKATTGEPIIVIKEGKIMEDALRKTQLDLDSLRLLLRQKGVFSISEVNYAVFETNGSVTVLKSYSKQPVIKEDLNVVKQNNSETTLIATEVITDGKINKKNLSRLNLDEEWLIYNLNKEGISNINEVFYAEVLPNGSLYIDSKDDNLNY